MPKWRVWCVVRIETYEIVTGFILSWVFFSVCIGFIERFGNSLESDVKKDPKAIEDEFRILCKNSRGRENRLVNKLKMV
jgi:hypothetical protein